jgi:hypothetical protein
VVIDINNKYFFIYNFKQAKYFIDNGLEVLSIGKGNKGDIYHKFLRDEKAEELFLEWAKQSKELKNINSNQ